MQNKNSIGGIGFCAFTIYLIDSSYVIGGTVRVQNIQHFSVNSIDNRMHFTRIRVKIHVNNYELCCDCVSCVRQKCKKKKTFNSLYARCTSEHTRHT